jgi:hypothetical protein
MIAKNITTNIIISGNVKDINDQKLNQITHPDTKNHKFVALFLFDNKEIFQLHK